MSAFSTSPAVFPSSLCRFAKSARYGVSAAFFLLASGLSSAVAADFGDAPLAGQPFGDFTANYPAATANLSSTIYFGTTPPDDDPGHQPDNNALGDDEDGNDDENGLIVTNLLVQGDPETETTFYAVEVDIRKPLDQNAFMGAFIDFNRDGDFNDPGETGTPFPTTVPVGSPGGTFVFSFSVPAGGVDFGPSFARFVISDTNDVSTSGTSGNGEVEDHQVFIASSFSCATSAAISDLDFSNPSQNGSASNGSTRRFSQAGFAEDGTPIDVVMEITSVSGGSINQFGDGTFSGTYSDNDAVVRFRPFGNGTATVGVRLRFVEQGTMIPKAINSAIATGDLDLNGQRQEILILDPSDLAGVGVNSPSNVSVVQTSGEVRFLGGANQNDEPESVGIYGFTNRTELEVLLVNEPRSGPSQSAFSFDATAAEQRIDNLNCNPNNNIDFGDAPDPSSGTGPGDYQTLLSNNGPRHIIPNNADIYFGSSAPDADLNGFSDGVDDNGNATDDEVQGTAAEDGITLPSNFRSGTPYSIDVDVTGTGFLNAWVDWNRNGRFGDVANERISTADQPVSSSTVTLTGTTPPGAASGVTYARFRVCSMSDSCDTPLGLANDGEVVDSQVMIASFDYGDAPISGTVDGISANYGEAAQVIDANNLYMGFGAPDSEVANQPTNNADGDDADAGGDDEDVSLPTLNAGDTSYTVTVPVFNNSGLAARLCGYIDAGAGSQGFDGLFTGADEQVCVDAPSNNIPTDYALTWTTLEIDPGATATFVRLRLSTNAVEAETPIGGGTGLGEVEDHRIEITGGDRGDAPASYGDPLHRILPGFRLGGVDPDPDNVAQHSANADGDDDDANGDDEDGFTPPASVAPGTATVFNVNVVVDGVVVTEGYLNAWVDWDGSGVFGDTPEEQIALDVASGTGVVPLDVTVPATAVPGVTYARFRLCQADTTCNTPDGPGGLGEVEDYALTVAAGDITIAGRVFNDNGAAGTNAHDGFHDPAGEAGLAGLAVQAIDVATDTVLAVTQTDGEGVYQLALPDSAAGTAVQITTALNAGGWRYISEAPAPLPVPLPNRDNPSTADGLLVFEPAASTAYSEVNFGQIQNPVLVEPRTASVSPGQQIDLSHRYTSFTTGDVTFSVVNPVQAPDGSFTITLFRDSDCNGLLDPAEPVLTDPVYAVNADEVCLIARVAASAGAPSDATVTFDLTAETAFTGTAETDSRFNTDVVAISGDGSVVLTKQVCNVTSSTCNVTDGTGFIVRNSGAPGDILEYRLVFESVGPDPIDNVTVFDVLPDYSTLEGSSVAVVTSPSGMTCVVDTPSGGGSDGYTGSLQWSCTGVMTPGDQGVFSFRVQVDD